MDARSVAHLARYVRERLAAVADILAPQPRPRQAATVIVGATAPFATTSYARARLARQMHASGLLSDEQAVRTRPLLELAVSDGRDAPR